MTPPPRTLPSGSIHSTLSSSREVRPPPSFRRIVSSGSDLPEVAVSLRCEQDATEASNTKHFLHSSPPSVLGRGSPLSTITEHPAVTITLSEPASLLEPSAVDASTTAYIKYTTARTYASTPSTVDDESTRTTAFRYPSGFSPSAGGTMTIAPLHALRLSLPTTPLFDATLEYLTQDLVCAVLATPSVFSHWTPSPLVIQGVKCVII